MTEADQQAFTQAFDRWFKGNHSAGRFCADMLEIAHTWDDYVDGDEVDAVRADTIFRKMVLEVPANDFYRANFSFLHPILVMVWAQWSAANGMETHPFKNDLAKAYMLRASIYQLFHACAVICGGLDWAAQVGPDIYRFYGESPEDFNA